jgi:hypothetical protein
VEAQELSWQEAERIVDASGPATLRRLLVQAHLRYQLDDASTEHPDARGFIVRDADGVARSAQAHDTPDAALDEFAEPWSTRLEAAFSLIRGVKTRFTLSYECKPDFQGRSGWWTSIDWFEDHSLHKDELLAICRGIVKYEMLERGLCLRVIGGSFRLVVDATANSTRPIDA